MREGAGFLGLSAGRGDIFSFPGLRFSVTSLNHSKISHFLIVPEPLERLMIQFLRIFITRFRRKSSTFIGLFNHKKAKGNPLFRPSCNCLKVNTDTAYPDTRGKAEKLSPALTFQAQTGERLVSLPAETIVSTRRDERIYK